LRGRESADTNFTNGPEFKCADGRLLVPPEALREAFRAVIRSAQAAGYSNWLAVSGGGIPADMRL